MGVTARLRRFYGSGAKRSHSKLSGADPTPGKLVLRPEMWMVFTLRLVNEQLLGETGRRHGCNE
jgi:hypothetical protein